LPLIHVAQGRTASFYSNLGVVTARQADADTLGADAYAAGMFRIAIEEAAVLLSVTLA
jgi:hypothetical protein